VAAALQDLEATKAATSSERRGLSPPTETFVGGGDKPRRSLGWKAIAAGAVLVCALAAATIMFWPRPDESAPGSNHGLKDPPVDPVKVVKDGSLPGKYTNSLGMDFVLVPKGKFWMGGGGGKPGNKEVEIPHGFYLGTYEVTQEEWEKVTGLNPSRFSRTGAGQDALNDVTDADLKRFPVENVSWEDAQLFLNRLNARAWESGWVYRLPTEAEWEYACRGGPGDKLDGGFDFYFEKRANHLLPDQASFVDAKHGLNRPTRVGSYSPNALGLYDMHGNVWEWCADVLPADPKDGKKAARRASRGGSWAFPERFCRAASRITPTKAQRSYTENLGKVGVPASLGLRVARVPVSGESKLPRESPLPRQLTTGPGMEFVLIPLGKFWLGGSGGRPGDVEVEIPYDFYLGKYEVTQEEWEKVTQSNPSHFSRIGAGKEAVKDVPDADLKRFPVENISWQDAQVFLLRFNERYKDAGWVYRLPTEAEWEYACRGGPLGDKLDAGFDFYFARPVSKLLAQQANFGNGLKRPCKVGFYAANVLGLHDMHGNVAEWCADTGAGIGQRVSRGGGWDTAEGTCRASFATMPADSLHSSGRGLRLARVPDSEEKVGPPITKGKATLFLRGGIAEVHNKLVRKSTLDTVRRSSYCKVFIIYFKAGRTYQIDMVSKHIDSYLRLEDSNFHQLAADDDGGGFPNARIVFNCRKDGAYRIICTTYQGGATGAFALRVVQR
jgi:formylglycine-generating enzyme required for sulfatase activity